VMKYEPGNPDADKDGYVAYPNINPATEMVDLMGSVRAYQLNASAVNATKQMIQQSIDILKS
jgi:flagellar basal-body rod protein FlgC